MKGLDLNNEEVGSQWLTHNNFVIELTEVQGHNRFHFRIVESPQQGNLRGGNITCYADGSNFHGVQAYSIVDRVFDECPY